MLALETTSRAGSVALAIDGRLALERDLPPGSRSAQSLAPAIDQALRELDWQPRQLGLVAVTVGPGSFTGVRVGVVTAKTLAYALGCSVLGVTTFELLAAQAQGALPHAEPAGGVEVVLDAGRGQLFRARLTAEPLPRWLSDPPGEICDAAAWLADRQPGCLVTGPALEKWAPRLPPTLVCAPREAWHPRASAVAQLAWLRYARGDRDDPWRLVPEYLRRSAAEEKAADENAAKR